MIGIKLVERGGDFKTHQHRVERGAIRDDESDSVAKLTFIWGRIRREKSGHEADAGDVAMIQFGSKLRPVNPRRAEKFEGRIRAAANGNAASLQDFDAGIEERGVERPQIRRGRKPRQASRFEGIFAMPILHLDDVQVDADFVFGVEHLRELAGRHGVARRQREISDEIELVAVKNRAFDRDAIDRIGAVENVKRNVMLRRGFHRITHRRDESVEAHAGVLNIVDERVDALKHLVGRTPRVAVEAVNRQPSGGVGAGSDVSICRAGETVLGTENGDEFYARCVRENVNGAVASAVHAGYIRDDADALALQRSEIFLFEDVDASESVVRAMVDAVEAVGTFRVNAALDFRSEARGIADVERGRHGGGNFGADP